MDKIEQASGNDEVFAWINSTLKLNLSCVEQASSGAVYCQLMDAAHPGMVPMDEVNFDATNYYDMLKNYNLLKEVFGKLNIDKVLDLTNLLTAEPPACLELMQWMKRHYDSVSGGRHQNYNPQERRKVCKDGKDMSKISAPFTIFALPQPHVKNTAPVTTIDTSTYDQQAAELKPRMDELEKASGLCFDKAMGISKLCLHPTNSNLPALKPIMMVLFADREDATSQYNEAKAALVSFENNPIAEDFEKWSKSQPIVCSRAKHNSRRSDAPPTNSTGVNNTKLSTTSDPSTYDQQITNMKLRMDALKKDEEFYSAKLTDIERLCQSPIISNLAVIKAIKRILCAAEKDGSMSQQAITIFEEEQSKSDTQKRKSIVNDEVDAAANTALCPKRRVSDASVGHDL